LDAVYNNQDIIWDQTSTTAHTRAKKLRMLPDTYETIAVVFPTPPADVLMKRLASRPGKEIPWEIVSNMIKNFEIPTESEGFNKIIHVS
jgi:tRNA uridine 5-carbamoylmethylation protein Kti12